MPALSNEIGEFLLRVKDSLRYGQDSGSRASATLASTAGSGLLSLKVNDRGAAGNDWTYTVTVPGGTSALAVSASGTDITIALAVSAGVATAANTLNAIAAAVNAAIPQVTATVVSGGTLTRTSAVSLTSFAGGADPATDVDTAPVGAGYLRAQDLATALELLQESTNSGELTATGGSTTTAVVASVTANAYVGAEVTFEADTTTVALRGVTATVVSNNGTTFTFAETLPGTVASGDTFRVRSAFLDDAIALLRGSSVRADAPPANVYGFSRTVVDVLQRMQEQLAGSALPNRSVSRPGLVTGSGSTTTAVVSADAMRPDQFKGMYLTISGATRRIVSNNETTLFLDKALSGAPSASTSFSIFLKTVDANVFPGRFHNVHPAGHPDAAFLAYLLDTVQNTVEAFVLPS